MMRARADIVGVCHAILHEPHRRGLELAVRLFEPAREIGECLVALGAAAFLIDDREESLDRAAAILRELAADEVHRLHAVRAFIDHRSEEHTSELQSLMRSSYAVICLKKKKMTNAHIYN